MVADIHALNAAMKDAMNVLNGIRRIGMIVVRYWLPALVLGVPALFFFSSAHNSITNGYLSELIALADLNHTPARTYVAISNAIFTLGATTIAILGFAVGLFSFIYSNEFRPQSAALALFSYVLIAAHIGNEILIRSQLEIDYQIRIAGILLLILSLLIYVAAWTGRVSYLFRHPWKLGTLVVTTLAVLFYFVSPSNFAEPVGQLIFLSLLAVVIVMALPLLAQRGAQPLLIAFSVFACCVWLAMSIWNIPFYGEKPNDNRFWGFMLSTSSLLPGIFILSRELIERRFYRLRDMQETISDQGQRLTTSKQALMEETQKRILLEERERLTRDVHDGLGGQLLSLLVQVRAGRLSNNEIEQELSACLEDLRLIVESLDLGNEDLASLLETFRARVTPQLDAVQINLNWSLDEDAVSNVKFSPEKTLSLFRLLQEAVSNTVRHAKASNLEISIGSDEKNHKIRIIVADDGIGIPTDTEHLILGRGLKNMRDRATQIGGTLEIENKTENSGVKLLILLDRED